MDLELKISSALEKLPPLREVIAAHNLRAEKKLGQNFLLDSNVTDKIVRQAGELNQATVFEIGPGPGGLTRSLLKAGARKVIALEFDPRAVNALQDLKIAANGRLDVIETDALEANLLDLAPQGPRAIVANLPYNIATSLLIGWLRQIREDKETFSSMTLMFQKEVGDRIIAKSGSKTYGRLSILCQWLCHIRKAYDLPPSAFIPSPKVRSSVIHFTPKTLEEFAPRLEDLERVTAAAFGQRRKMIRSSLKDYAYKIEALDLDPTARAENLSVDAFLKLASFKTMP